MAVLPWLSALRNLHSKFFTFAVVCGAVLLSILYHLSSVDFHNGKLPVLSAAVQRRREHVEYMTALHNNSVRLVWPRGDDDDDDDDHIISQINAMNVYAQQKRKRKLKVIVRVGVFRWERWIPGQRQFLSDRCPITDCLLTKDQSKARDADALLIGMFRKHHRRLYLPKPRKQIWIAIHHEPPLANAIDADSVRSLINWTVSYRHDSTIALRYVGKMVPRVPPNATATSGKGSNNYAAGKTKLVAWFVSICNVPNHRMRYAQELSKFIQV